MKNLQEVPWRVRRTSDTLICLHNLLDLNKCIKKFISTISGSLAMMWHFKTTLLNKPTTAWCSEISSLTSLDASQVSQPVTSENQFHCTRLYAVSLHVLHVTLPKMDQSSIDSTATLACHPNPCNIQVSYDLGWLSNAVFFCPNVKVNQMWNSLAPIDSNLACQTDWTCYPFHPTKMHFTWSGYCWRPAEKKKKTELDSQTRSCETRLWYIYEAWMGSISTCVHLPLLKASETLHWS